MLPGISDLQPSRFQPALSEQMTWNILGEERGERVREVACESRVEFAVLNNDRCAT